MSRQQLEDEILYQRRILKTLEETKTNCLSCDRKKYNVNECNKHGPIPGEFILQETCPDWEFQLVPF